MLAPDRMVHSAAEAPRSWIRSAAAGAFDGPRRRIEPSEDAREQRQSDVRFNDNLFVQSHNNMATRSKSGSKLAKKPVRKTARGKSTRRSATNGTSPAKTSGSAAKKRWSQKVTTQSDALDLDPGVFARSDPERIARALKRSAEKSQRRKSTPFRSAMSMLTFYENRAGKTLSATQRAKLDHAKEELRRLYGKA